MSDILVVMGDAEPQQIGTYEVLAKLADGGVGTVYLARRRGPAEFKRLVAIKRLHPQFARDTGFVTMFTDEARLAARIHHANVVSIVELGADDDGYYVVMEYVEGSNLGHFHWHATRRDGSLPRAVALRIALDALSGLHAAHEIEGDDGTIVNLVHRDVSPQNILIGTDGLARLGDFGIARASALRAFETRGAAVKGKLEYMAPEQIECKEVDRTTDLFAMGIVLWELLTGRRLFPAANQVTTIQRVCFDPIPSPRTINPSVTPELERIVMHALERPKARRYRTAAELAEDLERAARADAGIATQREVAACMAAVLGDAMGGARKALRDLSRAAAPAPGPVPDLARAGRGGASTAALPASDLMVQLPASPIVDLSIAHPPVGDERIDTEPYREPPTLTGARDMDETAVTVHYEEGAPPEVIAEANLRSRTTRRGDPAERTLAIEGRPDHPTASAPPHSPSASGPPHSPSASGPPHSPSASGPPRSPSVSGPPHSPTASGPPRSPPVSGAPHAPSASGPPQSPSASPRMASGPLSPTRRRSAVPTVITRRRPAPRFSVALLVMVGAVLVGGAIGGLGVRRLAQSRAASRAAAATATIATSPTPPPEPSAAP